MNKKTDILNSIRNLISKGYTEQAIDKLIEISKNDDKEIQKILLVISSEYSIHKRNKLLNLETSSQQLNNINFRLLNIIFEFDTQINKPLYKNINLLCLKNDISVPDWTDEAELRFSLTNFNRKKVQITKLVLNCNKRSLYNKIRLLRAGEVHREHLFYVNLTKDDNVNLLNQLQYQITLKSYETEAFKVLAKIPQGYELKCNLSVECIDLLTNEILTDSKQISFVHPIRSKDLLKERLYDNRV